MLHIAQTDATLPKCGVESLRLSNFRSYEQSTIECDTRPVVITGPNGAGKTNILEALSYLTSGRGLRRATLGEAVNRKQAGKPWGISACIRIEEHRHTIGTGLDADAYILGQEKRQVRIDGSNARSQSILNEFVSVLWLTPEHDRIFMESSGNRRLFLDRLIYNKDPTHASRLNAYEKAMRNRNRLLKDGSNDTRWLDALEDQIARNGVAICAARSLYLKQLESRMKEGIGVFPIATLSMSGDIDSWLEHDSALRTEERFIKTLHDSRKLDANTGRTLVGPHRSDFHTTFDNTGNPASDCSTGEQKALLISMIIGATRIQMRPPRPTLLLLDEVVAHLDSQRRRALFSEILHLGVQAWMTGTDTSAFSVLGEKVNHLRVENSTAFPKPIIGTWS